MCLSPFCLYHPTTNISVGDFSGGSARSLRHSNRRLVKHFRVQGSNLGRTFGFFGWWDAGGGCRRRPRDGGRAACAMEAGPTEQRKRPHDARLCSVRQRWVPDCSCERPCRVWICHIGGWILGKAHIDRQVELWCFLAGATTLRTSPRIPRLDSIGMLKVPV